MDNMFGICPYVTAQKLIAGKWSVLILYYLSCRGPVRFGELLRSLPELTQATLTKQLRTLEQNNLIVRKVFAEVPPRVEYSLSDMGREFEPVLQAYEMFGRKYIQSVCKEKSI